MPKNTKITDKTKESDVAIAHELIPKNVSQAIGIFIGKFAFPAANEYGQAWAEKVSAWRQENLYKLLNKADRMYNQNQTDLKKIHPRLMHHIVEDGSWSDSDQMLDMWAGLLATSCSVNGEDDSNLIFINILKQITHIQAVILDYACENCKPTITKAGLVLCKDQLFITVDQLAEITQIEDYHRLDRELDHMRSLELITMNGGFMFDSLQADITPSALGIQLYIRCQGYVGSPVEYFNLNPNIDA